MWSRYYCYCHSPALRLLPNVCWYQTPLFSWTCSTQLVAEQRQSTQWHPSAKRDSVSVSAAAYLLSASSFGLWLYPEDRRSQALDHPLRLLLQGQVCLRLTGYLKKGCFEPLTACPAHPPHLISTVLRFHGKDTGSNLQTSVQILSLVLIHCSSFSSPFWTSVSLSVKCE